MAIALHFTEDGMRIMRREFFINLTVSEYEKMIELETDITNGLYTGQELIYSLSPTAEVHVRKLSDRSNLELLNMSSGIQVFVLEKDEWIAMQKYFMPIEMNLGKKVFKRYLIALVHKNLFRVCDACLKDESDRMLHQCTIERKKCATTILNCTALTNISIPRFIKKLSKEAFYEDIIVQYPAAVYKRIILHWKPILIQSVLDMF